MTFMNGTSLPTDPLKSPQTRWTVVVLAGDRPRPDPLVQAAGVRCKALVPVGGTPMILRVLTALQGSALIRRIHVCGPPTDVIAHTPVLQAALSQPQIDWHPPQVGPSASVAAALRSLTAADYPVLITTADHALVQTTTVDTFLNAAAAYLPHADFIVALTDHTAVRQAYPDMRRTALHFRDGSYCGCNLFACLTPHSLRLVTFWQQVETYRKQPIRLCSALGWITVLRYLTRQWSLATALDDLSQRLHVRIVAVPMADPLASFDVDSIADWQWAERHAQLSSPRKAP